MKKCFALILLSLVPSLAFAFPSVSAMPSFHDFGSVPEGRSSSTTIYFNNNSNETVPFFNVSCSGDFSAFSCLSFCNSLPPYGTCSVRVEFNPRNGDGQRKMLWLNGSGSGAYATATVYGTDAKNP